jgi:hypothetical protein
MQHTCDSFLILKYKHVSKIKLFWEDLVALKRAFLLMESECGIHCTKASSSDGLMMYGSCQFSGSSHSTMIENSPESVSHNSSGSSSGPRGFIPSGKMPRYGKAKKLTVKVGWYDSLDTSKTREIYMG